MARRVARIASSAGLHARPAAVFVRAASQAPVPVTVCRAGGEAVPASSILAVMGLGIGSGEPVVLEAEGDAAEVVLDQLAFLLETEL